MADATLVALEILKLAERAVAQIGSDGPAAEPDRWMTVAEAAEYAAVKPCTVREWIAAKLIRHGRTGRDLRLRRSDVDAFLLRHECESIPPVPERLSAQATAILGSLGR